MNHCHLTFTVTIFLAVLTTACSQPDSVNTEPTIAEITAVTASAWEQKAKGGWADFPPEFTIDGNTEGKSSWRVEVHDKTHGQWIQYDLGQAKTLDSIDIQFLSGDSRQYTFDISVSSDGESFKTVWEGESSGTQSGYEKFGFDGQKARYVRLTGYGNTSDKFPNWFNIVETVVFVF